MTPKTHQHLLVRTKDATLRHRVCKNQITQDDMQKSNRLMIKQRGLLWAELDNFSRGSEAWNLTYLSEKTVSDKNICKSCTDLRGNKVVSSLIIVSKTSKHSEFKSLIFVKQTKIFRHCLQ